ncbi:MAG: hypothetical protein IPM54_27680 [Polyangiaceae bacterium]|nr:hypothetical protein [Polyangiaceae bacterium]
MRPTAGVRYAVERSGEEGSVVTYRGFAHLPDADIPLVVRVEHDDADGKTTVVANVEDAAHVADGPGLERAAAALVKAAARASRDAGRALPRRIVRWRGP